MSSYQTQATGLQKIILLVLVLIIIVFGGWIFLSNHKGKTIETGIQVAEAPRQGPVSVKTTFRHDEYTIIPLATFTMKGKILSKKRYFFGDGADIMPYDLAMGWKRMSDETILDRIKIWQISRWYRWKPKTGYYPIPRREIERCSANMHLIPANKSIRKKIKKADEWDLIKLQGYLVKVISDDNRRWKSSLTRNDTGGGACEVIWVEEFEILKS